MEPVVIYIYICTSYLGRYLSRHYLVGNVPRFTFIGTYLHTCTYIGSMYVSAISPPALADLTLHIPGLTLWGCV